MLNAMFAIIAICLFYHACDKSFKTEEESKEDVLQDYFNNKYKH